VGKIVLPFEFDALLQKNAKPLKKYKKTNIVVQIISVFFCI
jgi:hypothetical protein